jgi:hypothetical protein
MSRTLISFAVAGLLLATTQLEAQSSRTPPGNPSSDRPGSMSGLLQNQRVQCDLGMSRQQRDQLTGAQQGQGQLPSTDMLSQSQLQRLHQLHRQAQVAGEGLGMFLFDPEVAAQLDLSEEQLEEIAVMEISFRLWSFRFLRMQDYSEEATEFVDDMRFVVDLMIRDVVDDQQQALLDELFGEPLQEMPTGQNPDGTGSMGGVGRQSSEMNRAGGLFRPGQSVPNRGGSR